jgi:hypothetical protein
MLSMNWFINSPVKLVPTITITLKEIMNVPDQFIKIGRYVITKLDDENVWISDEGGEGGQFSIETLEAAIGDYYQEMF